MVAAMARPTGGDSIDQVRGSVWLLAAALALVAVAILLFVRPLLFGAMPSAPPDESRVAAAAPGDRTPAGDRRQPAGPPGSDPRPAKPVPRAVPPPQRAGAAPADEAVDREGGAGLLRAACVALARQGAVRVLGPMNGNTEIE